MSHRHSKLRKEQRQKKAKARQTKWEELSLEQQLRILDSRPGESKKQRAKIEKRIKAQRLKESYGG